MAAVTAAAVVVVGMVVDACVTAAAAPAFPGRSDASCPELNKSWNFFNSSEKLTVVVAGGGLAVLAVSPLPTACFL